jgi:tetratricopeptide (TPR) repeat protein
MKRVILTLGAFLAVATVIAQTAKQTDFAKIEKNIEKSKANLDNPKKNVAPKTWISHGNVLRDAYESMLLGTRMEMPIAEYNLLVGKPNEQMDEVNGEETYTVLKMDRINFYFFDGLLNSWVVTKPITASDPLVEALSCYKKAIELDTKAKSGKDIIESLTKLKYNFISEGLNSYKRKDFENANRNFALSVEVGEMPQVNSVDTAIVYYAAIAAQLAGKPENAIELFNKSIKMGYFADGNVYSSLNDAYVSLEKADEGLQYLELGFSKFPNNQTLLYGLINYYLSKGDDPNKVLVYLNAAKEKEPTNASLLFAEGTLHDKLENFDLAVVAYTKAIELDPNFFDAYYNLGALHYNKGVKYQEEANKLPAREFEKYDALMLKASTEFKNSIPFMEKATELNPNEKLTIETLKNLYFRFRTESKEYMDKYNAILEKIDSQQ